jgi:hypothetical protein
MRGFPPRECSSHRARSGIEEPIGSIETLSFGLEALTPRYHPRMTPIEKAEDALNKRIGQLQAHLREAKTETAQRFLFQSIVVCIGIGEALTDYVKMIGQFARGRHAELKQTHATLTTRHDDLLKSGQELLERLKDNPTDRSIRKEIEAVQRDMAAIQKTLRRGANALQRETAPSMAMIDKLAGSIRRFGEADELDALKRVITMIVENVRELYLAHPTLESKDIIDAASWEKSAVSAIDQATDFHEAYAHTGYQTTLALDAMTLAVSENPPRTAEEAINRANESVAARLKTITARFTTS